MAQHVLDRRGLTVGSHLTRRRGIIDHRRSSLGELLRHVDVVLVFTTLTLSAVGVVMVYTASRATLASEGISPTYDLKKQALYVVIGLAVMVVAAAFDYHRLDSWGLAVYGAVMLGLLVVMTPIGKRSLGAARWISFGSFQLQPSAFVALALVIAAAVYCSRHAGELDLRRIGLLLVMAGVPIVLVVKQPDLGTGIVTTIVFMTILVVAGIRARMIAMLLVLAAVGMFLVVHFGLLSQYQLDRLSTFVHQGQHQTTKQARGTEYNINQSMTAIGSGGALGKGLEKGPLTNLAYVPEQNTDFIFTAVGEQLGFAGTATVLALFGILVWRTLRAAQLARDQLGQLLCVGAFALIGFLVFQNAGMTMGIMPITGVPLPFLSYGGSSTIAFFAAVGLTLNVGMRRLR